MHLSELEELAAADPKPFLRDPRKITHLLGRVVATVSTAKAQVQQLHRDVQTLQLNSQRVGAATTMSPRDAVRYLSSQELAQVVSGTHKQLLNHVLGLQQEAAALQRQLVAEQGKFRFAVLSVLEDPSLPPEVRARLQAALVQVPPAPVQETL